MADQSQTLNTLQRWWNAGVDTVRAGWEEAQKRNPAPFEEGRKFIQAVKADTSAGHEQLLDLGRRVRVACAQAAVGTLSEQERRDLQEKLRQRQNQSWSTAAGPTAAGSTAAGGSSSEASASAKEASQDAADPKATVRKAAARKTSTARSRKGA